MKADTPRTDAAQVPAETRFADDCSEIFVKADFARELEREIAMLETRHAAAMMYTHAVVEENTKLREAIIECNEYCERCESVGLLYWFKSFGECDSSAAQIIKDVLSGEINDTTGHD